jgi:peptide/nickel transport system permease protein
VLLVVLKRCLQIIVLFVFVGSVCFLMIHWLPGDLATRIAASRYGPDLMSNQASAAVARELALDQPLVMQWLSWIASLLQANLGYSLVSGDSVWHEVSHQLGATLILSGASLALAIIFGVIAGTIAAARPNGFLDNLLAQLALIFKSLPLFFIALLFILTVAYAQGDLSIAGHSKVENILMPSLTLALPLSFSLARVVRTTAVPILNSNMVEFAQLKGLSKTRAIFYHGLPNTLNPTLAFVSTQAVLLIEGAVVVESIFAWPGVGHALVHAIFARDIPIIQGCAVCMALIFILLNFCVDLVMIKVDPRLQRSPSTR